MCLPQPEQRDEKLLNGTGVVNVAAMHAYIGKQRSP